MDNKKKINKWSNFFKKIIDMIFSIILLVILFPILLLSAIFILISTGRPIFYVSKRRICPNKLIKINKFRTMVQDANSAKYQLKENFMVGGFLDIPITSEVYTPIGRLLERFQIVELPQLFNILFNGMSFVGNRPLPEDNIKLLSKHKNWDRRFESPSGITGIAQVVGKIYLNPSERLTLESMYSEVYNSPTGNILVCDVIIAYYTLRLIITGRPLNYKNAIKILTFANYGNSLNGTN